MEMANSTTLESINDLQKRTCDCLNCIGQTTLKDIDLLIKKLTEVKKFCCSEHCKRRLESPQKGATSRSLSTSRSRIPLALTRLRRETYVNSSKHAENSQSPHFARQQTCILSSKSFVKSKEDDVAQQKSIKENHVIFYRNKSLDRVCVSKDKLPTHSAKVEIIQDDPQLTELVSKTEVVEYNPNPDLTDSNSSVEENKMQDINSNQLDNRYSNNNNNNNLCQKRLNNKRYFYKKNERILSAPPSSPINSERNLRKKIEINLTCKDVPTDKITFEMSRPPMTFVEDIAPFTEPYQKCLDDHRRELDDKINKINYLRREAQQNLKDKLDPDEDNRAYRSW